MLRLPEIRLPEISEVIDPPNPIRLSLGSRGTHASIRAAPWSPATNPTSIALWVLPFTDPVLREGRNDPDTTIICHMTGHQLWAPAELRDHIERVLRACAKHHVAVEINAPPWRLDLDWRWRQAAIEFGRAMSINPDAHSILELDHMHWASRWRAKAASHRTGS